jgi:hypothetical protein
LGRAAPAIRLGLLGTGYPALEDVVPPSFGRVPVSVREHREKESLDRAVGAGFKVFPIRYSPVLEEQALMDRHQRKLPRK